MIMSMYRLFLLILSLVGTQLASASQGELANTIKPSAGIVEIDINQSGDIVLGAHGASLGQIIDALAAKSGKPIRYQDAPDQPVSLSCHGQGLETVLRCLLGTDADLAFSYDEAAHGKSGHGVLAGVKVLSSTFQKLPSYASMMAAARSGDGQPLTAEDALALTRSSDPDQRARAIGQIGRIEEIDEVTLRSVYGDAIKDRNGDVRAAALNGLAILDAEASFPILGAAMADEDASVRLVALDGMDVVNENTLPYYDQALGDPDESVRALAELRLGIE
jgi:hypothetical protein